MAERGDLVRAAKLGDRDAFANGEQSAALLADAASALAQ
jgi:hypothetical protein